MKFLTIILLAIFLYGCGSSLTSTDKTAYAGNHRELSPATQAK